MKQECPLTRKSRAYVGGVLQVNWTFFITKSKLVERVCRPCGRKIRTATELCNFIEKAVSAKAEEDLNGEAG